MTLSYRPVHIDPLTSEADGGIDLKRIAPKNVFTKGRMNYGTN